MKKWLHNIFFCLVTSIVILSPNRASAVALGPFDVTIKLCRDIQYVTSIVNAWSQAAFPVTGQPGFVIMTVETTNPLLSVCDYIIQLSVADNTSAIFLTADKLNNITNQKWNDHLAFMKQTYRLTNSVYDFNTGKKRSGVVLSAQLAADMGTWQRQLVELSTGNNPQAIKERQEYDSQIAELANVAHQRAILKEGTTCPKPKTNSPDYAAVATTIEETEQIKKENESDVKFYKYQLVQFGPRFLNGVENVKQYYDDVQSMMVQGVSIKESSVTPKNVDTVAPTGERNSDGTAVRSTKQITQTVQQFSVSKDDRVFIDFKNKYERQYTAWARKFWEENSSSEGGQKILQDVFKPSLNECKESTLMGSYKSLTKDEYEKTKYDLFKKCQDSNKMDERQAIGIFSSYVDKIKDSLFSFKKNQASIWTLESQTLGRKRSINPGKSSDYLTEDVVCQETPEEVDLQLIQAKQQQVNAQYNEIIARETLKSGMQRDEEIRQKEKDTARIRLERMQIEKAKNAENDALASPKAIGDR